VFPNNEEQQGDAEKVLNLIDAYDRSLSDVNSEIEQFRLAYMAFYGYDPDEETLAKAKKTGAFGLDEKGEGVGIEFITKDMNDQVIENHLNRLEANIMRFGKSVNMTDEKFAGNLSGVAIRYKLMPLENKCITLERKMTASLRQQFRVLATAWAKKGIQVDYTNIFFDYKRNLPVNLTDEADSTSKLKGMISERTRLAQLSFVDDVDWELAEMAKDAEGRVNLDEEDNVNE
jgi:SPP1 family phage portal protein